MTLATAADVETLLQINVTNPADPRVVALLEMASELIEGRVGRRLEADTYTAEPYTTGLYQTAVLLRHWPVASIDAITEDGETLTETTDWRAALPSGIIHRVSSSTPIFWHHGTDTIAVTYTTTVPNGLRAIAAAMVARAFKAGAAFASQPSALAGLRQLTIGRWSATKDEGATGAIAAAPLYFTDAEDEAVGAWADRRSH